MNHTASIDDLDFQGRFERCEVAPDDFDPAELLFSRVPRRPFVPPDIEPIPLHGA